MLSFRTFYLSEASIMVYHGERGQASGGGFSGSASGSLGQWFGTNNPEYAKHYGEVGTYRINLNNPYKMPIDEFREFDRGLDASHQKSKIRSEELMKQGYDSIIIQHPDKTIEYILFDRNQAVSDQSQQQNTQQKGVIQTQIDTLIQQYQTQGNYKQLYDAVSLLIQNNPQLKDKIISYFNNNRVVKQITSR